jgi:hypothetical protein
MNRIILTILCLLLTSLPVIAGKVPDYYPEKFQSWGKLNRLDTERNVIVVNDAALRLAPQVKVYTVNTRFGTLDQLREGMTIGLQARGSKAVVSEVWVLPKDYSPKINAVIMK